MLEAKPSPDAERDLARARPGSSLTQLELNSARAELAQARAAARTMATRHSGQSGSGYNIDNIRCQSDLTRYQQCQIQSDQTQH